ncbi:MAG: 2-hydroxyacyl-CoA dehydratase [Desulfobacteraceae bacterium]|nr:2-hydroxyacyl-CoA dehydratase [Desulfobacteraceae bacterium]
MEQFKRFHEVAADPAAYAGEWKERTRGRVVATLCSYAPEEILLAANVLGFRILGTESPITRADAHLQSYSCTLVRGVLEEALAGRLDYIDGIVFPHTCDSIQRLSDIWRMNVKNGFHMDLVLPADLTTLASLDYMTAIMETFARELGEKLEIEITREDLGEAVSTCNQIRSAVMRIHDLRNRVPEAMAGTDLHAMVKAGMVMDRKEFLSLVAPLADALEAAHPASRFYGKRIIVAGGLCNMPDLFNVIEQTGSRVVMDDLCTGSRFFQGIIEPDRDIFRAIARRYQGRIVCPAKHSGLRARGEALVRMARESRADGVMFFCLKFCDPFGFDYPYIKQMLDENRVPSMLCELEDSLVADGQFETRCQAFIEML